jgi:hypothetical protein
MQLSVLVMTQDFYLFFVKLRVNNIVIYSYILIESPLTYGLHNENDLPSFQLYIKACLDNFDFRRNQRH